MFDQLLKTPLSRLIIVICVAAVLIAPGTLALSLFAPAHLWSLDLTRVLMLSLAVTLPFFVVNAAITYLWWINTPPASKREQAAEASMAGGAIFSVPPIYAVIVIKSAFHRLDAPSAVAVAVVLNLLLMCRMIMTLRKKGRGAGMKLN